MNLITTQVDLDFIFNDSRKAIPIVQGDDGGRVLIVNLYNNGTYVEVDSETDTITLSAEVDGIRTVLRKEINIENATGVGTRAVIPITSDLSRLSGVEHCVLRISSSNGIVHAAAFDLIVLKNPLYTNSAAATSSDNVSVPGVDFKTTASILDDLGIANSYSFEVQNTATLEQDPPYVMVSAPVSEGSYDDLDYDVAAALNNTRLTPEVDFNVGDVEAVVEGVGANPTIGYKFKVELTNVDVANNDTINVIVKWNV